MNAIQKYASTLTPDQLTRFHADLTEFFLGVAGVQLRMIAPLAASAVMVGADQGPAKHRRPARAPKGKATPRPKP
jgi:hypothetical protein